MKQLQPTGEYWGGLISGIGLGLFLSPMLLMMYFHLIDDYTTPRAPLAWIAVAGVMNIVLSVLGNLIVRRTLRRRTAAGA